MTRDKVGATAELSTVVEANGHSHPSSVRAYFSAECVFRSVVNVCQTKRSRYALSEGECKTCCTINGPWSTSPLAQIPASVVLTFVPLSQSSAHT